MSGTRQAPKWLAHRRHSSIELEEAGCGTWSYHPAVAFDVGDNRWSGETLEKGLDG